MTIIKKILRNTTIGDIELKKTGVTLEPSVDFDIEVSEFPEWATEAAVNEWQPFVASGDIQVKHDDGTTVHVLSAAAGEAFLKASIEALNIRFKSFTDRAIAGPKQLGYQSIQEAIENGFPLVQDNNITKLSVARTFNFTSGLTVVEDVPNNLVEIRGDVTFTPGKLLDFTFLNVGNTQNKWLEFSSSSAPSNELPFVAPFDGDFIGMTYINQNEDTNVDLDLYVNDVLEFTWSIRNKWLAYKTDLTPIPVVQGDRISMFAKKITGASNPSTPIVEALFQITLAPITEGGLQFRP